jgi:hypothetical protein
VKSGERQDQRDDHGRTDFAEEHEQQQHDQHGRFEQRVRHRADRALDQRAAVVERVDLHARRQARLQLASFSRTAATRRPASAPRSATCLRPLPTCHRA